MPPEFLVSGYTFLGQPFQNDRTLNPEMIRRLDAVAEKLAALHAESGSTDPLEVWCGVREPHIGWRPGNHRHGSGSAIDINVSLNPYIVTRTGGTYGGEAAAHDQQEMRQRAAEVYDRAVAFTWTGADTADVSIRLHDSIEVTYDRFAVVSESLKTYLGAVFHSGPSVIRRAPVPDVQNLPDGDPGFAAIPAAELLHDTPETAVASLASLMDSEAWRADHGGWPYTPEQQYWQLLRDFELVRTPMLHGDPRKPITSTRNPAKGFLHLGRDLVCELVRTGELLWGASDLGAGESGDVMHFHIANDQDYYPRVSA